MSSAVKKVAQVAVGAAIGFIQGGPWGALAGAAMAFYVASQQDKLDTGSLRPSEPSSQTLRSSKAAARYVLGRVSTGGVLAWGQEQAGDQTDGEWLHMVYVLSEGEIDGLEDIFLGEEVVQAYGEHASYELVTNPTQVNAFLKANSPDWRDTQIGRGLSFVRLSFRYSAEKYPSGIPDVRFVIRGRRDIYDPRTGTAGYSENTALHILWFLRNRCGVPDDEIVFASFANSASVCDEMLANADGSTSARYRSGCVIGADESRTQVMQKLEAACGGKLIRVGGRWMLQVGAYYGPYDFEITEDMVIGTVTGSTEPTNDSAINTVRGTFVDPAQAWAETDYPEVSVSEWVVADGGEAAETLSFSYVSNPYQAQRLANIELRRRRAGGTLSIPMNFMGYNCRPGRSVKVNLPSLNIVGEFIVTDWSMSADSGCNVSVAQNEPAIFDDAVGQPYNPIGFIKLPAGGLGSPTGLTWSTDDNAESVQGTLSWAAPYGVVTGYAITIRQGAAAVQAQQVPATALKLPLSGLPSGSYTMSVAALGPLTRSGEASITVSIDGPPIPESCVVQATIDTITLIPGNTLHGLNGGTYEYFFSTNPQATEGEYLGQGLSLTQTGLAFATNYAYFVRSKNAYGVSAFLKVVASTSSDVANMLDALKDKIESGQLAPLLREEIALISGPPDLPGSVNNRLEELDEQVTEITDQLGDAVTQVKSNLDSATLQAQQNLATARQQLQEQIDTVSAAAKALPYNQDKAYSAGQTVLAADGRLYQASQAVPKNTAPPNASYWTDIGQAVQTANGLAVRMTAVETKVTEQDGKLTAQSTRIDGVQSSLTTTNQNVTAAQQAAQDAATLAGGKGKVIVQSAAPAVADRLAQNLWIDTTGNANTPKRWSGSAWVAVTDKVATDAAAAAANALSVAQTKADATAVSQLNSTVSQQGDTITAQGQALTGVQSTLTTTNQNVTAAQQAAQDAATLAGGKGKVIVQSATPAAADRLVQNLWIDTTGNGNTPKRWSGSAWMAVTDKVATDAAAAAANALSVAQTKADASAVSNLTNRVTEAEGVISAQGQAITGVQSSLTTTNQNVTTAQQAAQAASDLAGGKGKVMYQTVAPTASDRLAQNLWIDTTGGANTPKRWSGSAWVAVTDKVATDAAAAAANALALVQTKADASAVNNLDSRVGSAEGKIEAQGTALTNVQAAVGNIAGNGANLVPAEYAVFGPTTPPLVMGGGQAAAVEADPHGFNGYVLRLLQTSGTGTTYFAPSNIYSGANIALKNKKYILAWDAKSTSGAKQMQVSLRTIAADGAVRFAPGQDVAITDQWARYSVVFDLTNAAFVADRMVVCISASPNPKDGIAVLVDRVMLEEQVGTGTAPSTFSIGNSAAQVGALANAVSQLDARVVQTETGLTSQGTALSGLQNSMTTTNQNVTAAQQAAQSASDLAGGKGKVLYQATAPAAADRLAQNLWIDTAGSANTPKRWSGSAWVAVTDKVATDAAAAAASALSQVATKADASTVQQLSNTVSQQGQTVTAQGQAITTIQASVGNFSQENLLRNPDFNATGDLVINSTSVITMSYHNRGDSGVPVGAPAERLLCMSKVGESTGWGGQALVFRNGSVQLPVQPGEAINLECQMFCENPVQGAGRLALTFWVGETGSESVGGNIRVIGYDAALGGWQKLTVQRTVPAGVGRMSLYVVPDGLAPVGFKMWVANLKIARQGAGEAALASAAQALDSRVSQTESGLTSQGSAITSLTNSLSTTNQNVSAAQQAAQAASDLAGGKGKVIIQSATPTTADRLAQNLWIDTTGNANTPKRWSGSAWVAVTDKVATDAATAAASALSQVAAKADASTVQALTNTVTQQGTTLTAQGSEITNIKASVGVVSAENLLFNPAFADGPVFSGSPGFSVLARNDASVPVGAPSPRVVKWPVATSTGNNYLGFQSALNVRPPENAVTSQIAVAAGEVYDFELYAYSSIARQHGLWIQFYDLEGASVGHNWVAAAGDGVRLTTMAQTWTKLTGQATVPAGCVRMAMTFRVSVGDATDVFLSSPIARKRAGQDNAQASALQSVDARVSVTEGAVLSQGSAITQLNNAVAGKADNSALQSLQGTVTQQGNTLSSQGQAVTQLQSSISGMGGSGSNLLADDYSWLTSTTLPATAVGSGVTREGVAVPDADSGFGYQAGSSTNSFLMLSPTNNLAGWNVRIEPGVYLVSMYIQCSAATNGRVSLYNGTHRYGPTLALPTTRTRVTFPVTVTDSAKVGITIYFNLSAVSGLTAIIDSVMIEKRVGDSNAPSPFVAGPSARAVSGQATAISQLNTTVNQQGTAITAQASRLDGLYVQVNPEMEGDSSGLAGATGGLVGVWTEQSARIEDGIAMGRQVETVQAQMGQTNASVQQVSEVMADINGRVSAQTTLKVETNQGGRKVVSGIAIGSNGEEGEILLMAQRLAIIDSLNGQTILPFVVEGGQVFINQAVINTAFIQQIVAGMTIRSAALNAQGLPLLEINFAAGTFTLRGQDANGSTLLNNGGLYVYDANGIERTAVGRLT